MAPAAPQWLIPFKGRKRTGPTGQNFLWRAANVYVMDNHRAAAWCWAQEVPHDADHGLFHIDRHSDALEKGIEIWLAQLPNGIDMGIDDYLALSYDWDGPGDAVAIPVFRWDNYLPIHLALATHRTSPLLLATHRDGDPPSLPPHHWIAPWDLLEQIEDEIERRDTSWILNIDLDYFFCSQLDDCVRFLDDAYFDRLCEAIARLQGSGKLTVITIALTATDNFTDGWPQTEALAERLCAALGLSFKLP